MIRRLLVIASALGLSLGLSLGLLLIAPAASANPHRGELYEKGTYDDPYSFDDDECGFAFHGEGRSTGHYRTYRAPGSD